MEHHYSVEKSVQMLISLLKQHNIRKIVASPGNTNLSFVWSVENDPWFEVYSSVDERSAAYIACGLAQQSNEPVVISCTGATASRNYIPGLTEAFYSKIPVLALTSTQGNERIGHLFAQVMDRTSIQNDIAIASEYIPCPRNEEEEWSNNVKINRALLALRHHGGGPVHLDFQTIYPRDYSVKECPKARAIFRTSFIDPESNPEISFLKSPLMEELLFSLGVIMIFLWKQPLPSTDFVPNTTLWFSVITLLVIKANTVSYCP